MNPKQQDPLSEVDPRLIDKLIKDVAAIDTSEATDLEVRTPDLAKASSGGVADIRELVRPYMDIIIRAGTDALQGIESPKESNPNGLTLIEAIAEFVATAVREAQIETLEWVTTPTFTVREWLEIKDRIAALQKGQDE